MAELHPVCCWIGVGEDGETVMTCNRPAHGYVENEFGHRWFACDEHVGDAKARAHNGRFVHGMLGSPGAPSRHPSVREAISYR
jgi:hypothetical protein